MKDCICSVHQPRRTIPLFIMYLPYSLYVVDLHLSSTVRVNIHLIFVKKNIIVIMYLICKPLDLEISNYQSKLRRTISGSLKSTKRYKTDSTRLLTFTKHDISRYLQIQKFQNQHKVKDKVKSTNLRIFIHTI